MSNVYVFSGFFCNGKTTLIQSISGIIKEWTNKKVVVLPEMVDFVYQSMDIIHIPEMKERFINSKSFRQSLFLMSSLPQTQMLRYLKDDNDYVILMDRCLLDVFIFYYLNVQDYDWVGEIEDVLKELKSKGFGLSLDDFKQFNYLFFDIPENEKVIKEKCFSDIRRQETISLTKYREDAIKLQKIYKDLIDKENIKHFGNLIESSYIKLEVLNCIYQDFVVVGDYSINWSF